MRGTVLAVLVGLCSVLHAVEVEPVNKRDTPIVIGHEAGQKINAIFVDSDGSWRTLPDEHFRRGNTETIFSGPPGQYLITAGDSEIVKIVEDGKPEPKPHPEPKPDPEPGPDPAPEPPEPGPGPILATWVVWLEEQQEGGGNPDATDVMDDAGFRQSLDDKGIKVRVYDDDQPEARSFVRVAGDIRPAMILVESPTAYRVFPAPKTVEEAERIIRETVVR